MRFDAASLRAAGDPTRTATAEAWLADEVVVDFPSVRPLVDRMRSAFFGDDEPDAAWDAAELRLTAQQAFRGGRVPVEVPVRHVCRGCGGRGEVWSESCPHCAGQGGGVRRRLVEVFVPSGVRHGARLALSVELPQTCTTRLHFRVSIA